jgi:hypothetical protein
MQAIITKYLPATMKRSSRIRAKCERGQIIASWSYDLDAENNHIEAARELCRKFAAHDAEHYMTPQAGNPWLRPFVSGCLLSGEYAHVFLPRT